MALLARDVMTRDVAVVEIDADLETLERSFVEARVSGFPVAEGGRIVGVVSRADVLRALGGDVPPPPPLPLFYADLGAFEEEDVKSFSDAAAVSPKRTADLRVADLVTREIVAVAPDTPLRDVAKTISDHGIHRALVIDDGSLVGIVSALDIVRLVARGKLVGA